MSIEKLQEKIRKMKNPSVVEFNVELERLPKHLLEEEHNERLAYGRFCRELLEELKDIVPAVRFNMGAFSLMGADGMFLLYKLTEYAKERNYYVILDAPESISSRAAEQTVKTLFAENCPWLFDGLVVSAYAGSDVIKPYVRALKDSNKALFVTLRTANKSAAELQDLLTGTRLVHMAAADIVKRLGEPLIGRSGYSQVAGIGPANVPDVLKKLRDRYKNLFFLLDVYDYSNSNAKHCSYAFDKLGHGAVVCSGMGITHAWDGEESNGEDYVKQAQEAAMRMRKNLSRYVTVL